MTTQRRTRQVDTPTRSLDVAERLVQRRGFNGFSYADVAAELRLTKAALHYHFAGKAELGEALLDRYTARFAVALEALDTDAPGAPAKLEGYANLYLDVLRDKRMCLCGMLAAEYQTLPAGMQREVTTFFEQNTAWLTAVLERGRDEGTLSFTGPAQDAAAMVLGALEGALLLCRMDGSVDRFRVTATRLLTGLRAAQAEVAAG
jgi:TetR/AcrR family transcriptional regulator, transcriptional repressor for nem operon